MVCKTSSIRIGRHLKNVRENRRCNQELTIHRNISYAYQDIYHPSMFVLENLADQLLRTEISINLNISSTGLNVDEQNKSNNLINICVNGGGTIYLGITKYN